MIVSLQFQEVHVDKSSETSAVALKSTKKWNFSKRKEKLGRYAKHSYNYKSRCVQKLEASEKRKTK